MAEQAVKTRTTAEILGETTKARSVVQDIFVSAHPGLANEEEALSELFPQQRAGEFLVHPTNLPLLLSKKANSKPMTAKLQATIAAPWAVFTNLMGKFSNKSGPSNAAIEW